MMNYARIRYQNPTGYKCKYVKATEVWKIGRYIERYLKDKNVELTELNCEQANIIITMGMDFVEIK